MLITPSMRTVKRVNYSDVPNKPTNQIVLDGYEIVNGTTVLPANGGLDVGNLHIDPEGTICTDRRVELGTSGVVSAGAVQMSSAGLQVGQTKLIDGVLQDVTLDQSVKVKEQITDGTPSVIIGNKKVEYGSELVPYGLQVSPRVTTRLGHQKPSFDMVWGPVIGMNILVPDLSVGTFVVGDVPQIKYDTGTVTLYNPGYEVVKPVSGRGLLWGFEQSTGNKRSTPFWAGYVDCTAWNQNGTLVLSYVAQITTQLTYNTLWSHVTF